MQVGPGSDSPHQPPPGALSVQVSGTARDRRPAPVLGHDPTVAFTLTTRLGLPHWSAGADGPSRVQMNDPFAAIDAKAAYDDGAAGGAVLPTSDVVNGRYAATVDGPHRRLFRRAGGTWTQVGGTSWGETTYARADGALPASGAARVTSHPSLANPKATSTGTAAPPAAGERPSAT